MTEHTEITEQISHFNKSCLHYLSTLNNSTHPKKLVFICVQA